MRLSNIIEKSILTSIILACALVGRAEVKLSSHFGSGMVLQQKSTVHFRGTAKPNSKLTIVASWDKKKEITTVDSNGKWEKAITTPRYGGPYTISFNDGVPTILDDILIGEVWLCSGQSNMEMPVKGFTGQPVLGCQDYIAAATPRRAIRLFQQPNDWSTTEKTEINGAKWVKASSENVAKFSATGYFFADMLEKSLEVPVGIIQCAWSMSKIEAWMPKSVLTAKFPKIEMPDVNQKEFGWTAGTPTLLWNAMVKPWQGFPIKGVIWYQGEANTPNPRLYKELFPVMVEEWRKLFNNPEMSFFYAQIAPWKSEGEELTDWADFRQVQLELLDEVSNVGMVVTADIGDKVFIHCPKKIEVGKRFSYLALNKVYGYNGLMPMGPIVRKCVRGENGEVLVAFENGRDGLTPENQEIEGFELVDASGKIVKAKARILNSSDKVKVWSEEMPNPVEVRYCYRNYFQGELFNNAHLPASPFKKVIEND